MAGRPTPKLRAAQIFEEVGRSHNIDCVNKALKAANADCANQSGRSRGSCMDARYKTHLRVKCKALFEQKARAAAKNMCSMPGCEDTVYAEIMGWINGTLPAKASASSSSSASAKNQSSDLPSADDSWQFEDQVNNDSGGESKAGPLGVPILGWVAGGALAVFLLVRRKQ